MKSATTTGKVLISSLALLAACSLQGGLTTDLGENEVDGGSGGSGATGAGNETTGGTKISTGGTTSSGKAGSTGTGGLAVPGGGETGDGGVPAGPQGGSPSGPDPSGGEGPGPTVLGFASIENEHGFAFEDSFYLTGCGMVQEHDCLYPLGACPNQGAATFEEKGDRFEESFQMGGELGEVYLVTISVNGIAEGKYYQGGTRRAGEAFTLVPQSSTDFFYVGGTAVQSNYRTYKLSVLQPDGTTAWQHYYLNSVPISSGGEAHQTFEISYQATIEVPGQGVIKLLNQDANCHSINNCGEGDISGGICPAPRNVPNEPGLDIPALHGGRSVAELNAVNGAQQPFHAQVIHVRVLNVTLK